MGGLVRLLTRPVAVRWGLQTQALAVAAVGLVLGGMNWVDRLGETREAREIEAAAYAKYEADYRAQERQMRSAEWVYYEMREKEPHWLDLIAQGRARANRYAAGAEHMARMKRKWERGARRPWESVAKDTPPEIPPDGPLTEAEKEAVKRRLQDEPPIRRTDY